MAKKLNSVLGVDIGSQKIKICEIKTQGREPIVTALGMIDTPEGAVDHTGVYNSDAVGTALKQVIAQSGATTAQAVVSIAGQASVLVRTLEVPKMNPTELKEHMQWEINRNIPFAESTIVSDFKPLGGDDPNSPNMDVVMAIAPQSAIDTMVECLKKAGRQAAAIDVEPLSMARSIQTSYDDMLTDKTICMVDIGHTTTSINIYFGQKLLMPRQVPIGGELFTRAISDALAIPFADAEVLKREKGEIPETAGATAVTDPFGSGATEQFNAFNPFADDPLPAYGTPTYGTPEPTTNFTAPDEMAIDPITGAPMSAPVDPLAGTVDPYGVPADPAPFDANAPYADPGAVVDPLAGTTDPYAAPVPDATPVVASDPESARVYLAMAAVVEELASEVRRSIDYYRSRGGNIDAVVLCGGGSMLRGLASYLSRSIGVTCDAYDPLRRLNVNMRKVAPGYADEHRQEFAVAVGNGLHIFFD